MQLADVPLWRNRSFVPLVIARAVSKLGDGIYWAGMMWLVYTTTQSVLAAGGMIVSFYLPAALFSLVGGAFSDRYNRKRILIGSDVVRGLLLMVVALLTHFLGFSIVTLYATSVALAAAAKFFEPSAKAIIPEIVRPEQLARANSVSAMAIQVCNILGPISGGLLVAFFGASAVLGIDGLTFLVSAALIASMAYKPGRTAPAGRLSMIHGEIGAGLLYLVRSTTILGVAIALAIVNMFLGPLNVVLPRFATESLNVGAAQYGILGASFAAGIIVGASFVPTILSKLGPVTPIFLGLIGLGVFVVSLGQIGMLPVALGAMFAMGISVANTQVAATVMLQRLVPSERRGRTFGSLEFINNILFSAGVIAAGAIVDRWPMGLVFIGMGLAIIIAVPLCWRMTLKGSQVIPVPQAASTRAE